MRQATQGGAPGPARARHGSARLRHSGYWADPRVWDVINHVAAQMPRDPIPSERVRQIVAGPGS
jgi:hypothetical protein